MAKKADGQRTEKGRPGSRRRGDCEEGEDKIIYNKMMKEVTSYLVAHDLGGTKQKWR